ncbi:MAG: DUF4388 domain-containing protein [Syntrophorhabdales bacterium]
MPNDFIGELSKATLFELVKPLLSGKRSGMVQIKGNDVGELHIEAGTIIHGKTSSWTGEEAVFVMMNWDTGLVTFDWEATTGERTVSVATERLLERWINREREWEEIRGLITSPDIAFRIPLDSNTGEMRIEAAQWKVLALCDGTRTIGDIAETLKWDVFETTRIVYRMVEAGLLEKASKKAPDHETESRRYLTGGSFSAMEHELARIMGPIAPLILDEKLEEFRQSRDAFPQNLALSFVQAVALEIADDSKRASFTMAMAALLSRMEE